MKNTLSSAEVLMNRAVEPKSVHTDGKLTSPRSYGVYQLPNGVSDTSRYRFGNHPVRQTELEREFGICLLAALFLSREDAKELASILNSHTI